jgi:hypothetical protein
MPTQATRSRTTTIAALIALASSFIILAPACSNKMEPKDCDKIRGDAFDIMNKGQQCNTDADCQQSDWPGCPKPVSHATSDTLKKMSDSYKKGQCDEPKVDCKSPPEVYCKQGLCVHREKGTPENMAPSTDQIQIK